MTPLGVSLAFVVISILISAVKHFIFPSQSSISKDQSEIKFKKLYTITNTRPSVQSKPYASFYEAFYKFQLSQTQNHRFKAQQDKIVSQYNDQVLKKSAISDEFTFLCEQDFLITVSEGIQCPTIINSDVVVAQNQNCYWQTSFRIYELPLLREQTKQTINLKGRIETIRSDKRENSYNKLKCNKILKGQKYQFDFPLKTIKTSSLLPSFQEEFSLNRIQITKSQDFQNKFRQNEMEDQIQKIQKQRNEKKLYKPQKNSKIKRSQSKRNSSQKSIPQNSQTNIKSYNIETFQYHLKDSFHFPSIYKIDKDFIAYSTEEQPWLIRYFSDNSWSEINILQNQIQTKIFQNLIYQSRLPPFDRNRFIQQKFIFSYQVKEQKFFDICQKQSRDYCKQVRQQNNKRYLTVVYLDVNNPYRVQKFYVQLTFQIQNCNSISKDLTSDQQKDNFNQIRQAKMISYSIMLFEVNPSRQIMSDCAINHKKENIFARQFDKYYWLYQNKLIFSVDQYSLFCTFSFDFDQHIRTVSIKNIVHSSENNKDSQLLSLEWKTLRKLINYKDSFQNEILNKKINSTSSFVAINKTDKKQNPSETKNDVKKSNLENNIISYIEILTQLTVNLTINEQKTNKFELKQTVQTKSQKRKTKEKNKKTKNNKNNNKSKKSMNKKSSYLKENTTPAIGSFKPKIQQSPRYTAFKATIYPHRSQVIRHKFSVPFVLSFIKNIHIIDADIQKPLIYFAGLKKYLLTYKQGVDPENESVKKLDYKYFILNSDYQGLKSGNLFQQKSHSQIEIQKMVLKFLENKGQKHNSKVDSSEDSVSNNNNVIKSLFSQDQKILNQIKTVKIVPVNKHQNPYSSFQNGVQTYQRYIIVVWGWGIEVYLLDWDKSGFLRQKINQNQIQFQLQNSQGNLIQYFLPFIQIFATFYCMFQALISSR